MVNEPRDMSAELETGRRHAWRVFTASFMSNTKWRAFFSVVHAVEPPVRQLVVKFTSNDREQRTGLPLLHPPHPFVSFFEFGPVPLVELEWIEIPDMAVFARRHDGPAKQVPQDVEAVREAIERMGKLYRMERTTTGLRVFGHLR